MLLKPRPRRRPLNRAYLHVSALFTGSFREMMVHEEASSKYCFPLSPSNSYLSLAIPSSPLNRNVKENIEKKDPHLLK